MPRWDSNPRSQQASGRWDRRIYITLLKLIPAVLVTRSCDGWTDCEGRLLYSPLTGGQTFIGLSFLHGFLEQQIYTVTNYSNNWYSCTLKLCVFPYLLPIGSFKIIYLVSYLPKLLDLSWVLQYWYSCTDLSIFRLHEKESYTNLSIFRLHIKQFFYICHPVVLCTTLISSPYTLSTQILILSSVTIES